MRDTAGSRPLGLLQALSLLQGEDLRRMVNWLSVPKPRPTRKHEMAAAVGKRLAGASLRRLWDDLDEIQQLAVREALYGSREGLAWRRFEAKYGERPSAWGERIHDESLPLRFFLYFADRYGGSAPVVPADLAERLLEFAPPPPEATLASREELPEAVSRRPRGYVARDETSATDRIALIRRDMERSASRDLLSVLRLTGLGRVAVGARTGRASAAAVLRIAEVLDGGDFFDPAEGGKPAGQTVGPVRAFAWSWLLQAGGLAEVHGSKLALTKPGHAALGTPAAETLRRLWRQWVKTGHPDEFARIEDIKGQQRGKGSRAMTAAARRRPAIAEALARCPPGRWVHFDDFSSFMQAAGLEFEVTRDPWTLYIQDPHYGSLGYAGYHDWNIIQGRYLLCLLFEYAATLGLIDIAYTHPDGARPDFAGQWGTDDLAFLSRYDGLEYFRLNPLGAYCLGLADSYEPAAPSVGASLTVFPDLRVCADMPLSLDELLMLETFADHEADGVWRLARDKALAAIESGHNSNHLRAFLSARDDQPLPETVEGFLRNVERGARALELKGTALLIECADEEVAARIGTDKRTAKLCVRAGKLHLVVRTEAETAFRKAVREIGYGLPRS